MAEDEDMEDAEKFTKRVNLGLAHAELTRFGAPSRSEADTEKILRSLFVSAAEYEQYASDLRERETHERKEVEAREVARQARLENDPKYWKRLYEDMVEHEKRRKKEQKTNRDMWIGAVIVLVAFAALAWLLERLGVM
jgi:hypothetical protein